MSRVPTLLAALSGPPIVVASRLGTSRLVPAWLPLALAVLGTLLAVGAAWRRRPRVHLAGVLVAVAGAALSGPAVGTLAVATGTLGAVLAVASLSLSLELPAEGGRLRLVVVSLLLAVLATAAGTGTVLLAAQVGAGGLDARGGVTAWIAIATAATWLLARRALAGGEAA